MLDILRGKLRRLATVFHPSTKSPTPKARVSLTKKDTIVPLPAPEPQARDLAWEENQPSKQEVPKHFQKELTLFATEYVKVQT